ncbi:MAG: ABC-type transport auxiliary lipoprotein family protein [Pacificimonas sp.]|nr:ABC-type transport auxiliary lipoprotein family protein [Pacificimonas sp.]
MIRVLTLAAGIGLALTACGPIVQIGGNSEALPSLLNLDPARAPSGNTSGQPLLIALPEIPGKLRTLRVPVTTSGTEVQYLGAANWIEQPHILFQRLLMDVIAADTGRPVIDEGLVTVVPEYRLSGSLREFGLDVSGSDGAAVVIRYDAVLSTPVDGFAASRSFTARQPVFSQSGPAVADALSAAANLMAEEIASWIAAQD